MDVLERFAAGDLESFEALFRQHQKKVYAWIVRIVRDSGIAEDLTVETFWRIYRSRARFNPAGNFPGWAHRIATHIALDHLRRARREPSCVTISRLRPNPIPPFAAKLTSASNSPSASFLRAAPSLPRSHSSSRNPTARLPRPWGFPWLSSRYACSAPCVSCATNSSHWAWK